ncbi:OmpA family protein [Paucibacter sp. R3-3]|uniref:OmpA family protein n=1 Tax=Roseateles agri TaxID=3098619 RepID=A0ABU5DK44_9BURK|nr:OmpA family protein [Paucibacter sp. R3-3]MDY0746680.1 OmpA family protein [Paucibacter sp. R3-3]
MMTSKNLRIIACASAVLVLTACADMSPRDKGTAQGAGIGALGGAALGALVGGGNGATKGAVIGGIAGAIGGNIWSKKQEERQRALEQQTQGTGVEVTRTADNQLKLNIPSDISFDVGRADIKPNLRGVLDDFAYGLKDDAAARVRIVGHTDNTGTDAINDPLSERRAESVRNYLVDRGVSGGRIDTAGRGEREPIADNSTEAGRAKNRRVEIYIREPEQKG